MYTCIVNDVGCSHAGIATNFVPSTRIDDLIESLSQSNVPVEQISAYMEQFSGEYEEYSLAKHLKDINHCFSALSISEIMNRVEEYPKDSWMGGIASTLKAMSPTAVVTSIGLLRRGKTKTFKNCIRM